MKVRGICFGKKFIEVAQLGHLSLLLSLGGSAFTCCIAWAKHVKGHSFTQNEEAKHNQHETAPIEPGWGGCSKRGGGVVLKGRGLFLRGGAVVFGWGGGWGGGGEQLQGGVVKGGVVVKGGCCCSRGGGKGKGKVQWKRSRLKVKVMAKGMGQRLNKWGPCLPLPLALGLFFVYMAGARFARPSHIYKNLPPLAFTFTSTFGLPT